MSEREVVEGSTRFFIPEQDENSSFPPGSAAVFYNSRMRLNRDSTNYLLRQLDVSSYFDAMGASGVRGLRVAHECGIPVTINDLSPEAIALIRRNASLYPDHDITVTEEDCRAVMLRQRFDVVDLDPFGTPAPFVDIAATSARRYLFVTATDTAPLCGAHLKAGIRRYGARPMNTEYHSEVGLRILLGFVLRETAKYDRGIEPLFCFAREHFVRLHLRMTGGAGRTDNALKNIGYIHQCTACPWRMSEAAFLPTVQECPECGAKMSRMGPLWVGPINDPEILSQIAADLKADDMGESVLARLVTLLDEELSTPAFYNYHQLARHWHLSPSPVADVITAIRDAGYQASRTHYDGRGIKTDAPLHVLKSAIVTKK
ncbi:MAG: tRNA (guanine(10)-N(2))-dimethyltransferase [Methanomicrobiales archaeon]|jgi:tRNA (guanine26-N2/guanine27-N2)-dimethyltransferase|nr:tRNA (guanine(10)-N(2))-dimethyltransferase [Methanomicrobiales archaeon]